MFGALRGVVALSRSARKIILVAGTVALALAAASRANAACVADARNVALDKKTAVPFGGATMLDGYWGGCRASAR